MSINNNKMGNNLFQVFNQKESQPNQISQSNQLNEKKIYHIGTNEKGPKRTIQLKYDRDYVIPKEKYKIGHDLDIKFKNSFNEPIDEKLINKFRMYNRIVFGFSFNQIVKNKIPSSITHIQFGHNFNQDICNIVILGENDLMEEFVLGEKFNQLVNNLSPNLKFISFGYDFNHPVDNLPNQIEFIKFGHNFNHPVEFLPNSLKHIIFGNSFNFSIDNLPSSIEYIELYGEFDKKISCIPFGLKEMKLDQDYYERNKSHLDDLLVSLDENSIANTTFTTSRCIITINDKN